MGGTMIDDKVKKLMEEKSGVAFILAGSDSDDNPIKKDGKEKLSHIDQIFTALQNYGIHTVVKILSAHKQGPDLDAFMDELNTINGLAAYVTVAGGTDALSGEFSYRVFNGPTYSCPPDAPNSSCTNNPPLSSNAYIEKPKNVARAVAQVFAGFNPEIKQKLQDENNAKITKLKERGAEISEKYAQRND